MEEYCSPLASTYFYPDEGIEELRHCLLYITELEATIISAKEEITRREIEIVNLKDLLNKTTKERNEAQEESQKLFLEKIILQQLLTKNHQNQEQDEELQPIKQETPPPSNLKGSCSSEDELGQIECPLPEIILKLAAERPLPEKGKLLQAVKDAGPLLRTLLVAGPLPQWQHPPPQIHSIDIPPITIKRPLDFFQSPDSSSSPPIHKYQKVSFL